MAINRHETTDGRYVRVAIGEWWDTTGIDILPESVVDEYLDANPDVGIIVRPPIEWEWVH